MTSTVVPEIDLPGFIDGRPKRHLIDGAWVESSSGETFPTFNPSTGQRLGEMAVGTAEDVDRAVAAARRAFDGPWASFTPAERQDVLLRLAALIDEHFDELRMIDVLEMGSPVGTAPAYMKDWTKNVVRYFAGWATKLHGETIEPSVPGHMLAYTRKEPVGVVGGIIPWNGPAIGSLYKIAPVLATGCTLVLKPSEQAGLAPLRIGELIQELGLPPGVINIVSGDGATGAAITAHPDVDKIAFTGSHVNGQKIIQAAAGNLKRVTLELGGKSPDIVFADADLEKAAIGAGMGVFFNTGQACVAGTRIFVQRPVYEEFLERLAGVATSLQVGNSLDPGTQIGPIVSQRQLERVTGYLEVGPQEGARVVAGGARLTDGDLADGYFVAPTVYADVTDDMRVAKEEIFGPVASVLPFDDDAEVVRRANATNFGLAGGVWTRDMGRAHRTAHAIRAGIVWINTYHPMDISIPFGGYKMSGWGREGGREGLEEYLNTKTVWADLD
jgi:aldehyde dehydrogenase (NAD+)